jgi:hypothetical protein
MSTPEVAHANLDLYLLQQTLRLLQLFNRCGNSSFAFRLHRAHVIFSHLPMMFTTSKFRNKAAPDLNRLLHQLPVLFCGIFVSSVVVAAAVVVVVVGVLI